MHVYVCEHIYNYIMTLASLCVYIYSSLNNYICIYMCVCVCINRLFNNYIYIYIYILGSFSNYIYIYIYIYIYKYIYNNYHHVAPLARVSLTLAIFINRPLHSAVSLHYILCLYRAVVVTLVGHATPCEGVHKRTSLLSLSLLVHQ